MRLIAHLVLLCTFPFTLTVVLAQDASTGAIRGTVHDPTQARVVGAGVVVTNMQTGLKYNMVTDDAGVFTAQLLPTGDYEVAVTAVGMAPYREAAIHVDLGAMVEIEARLVLSSSTTHMEISGDAPLVETRASNVANVIDERSIDSLPLNGRRFSDLALLTPGVNQDPRGLTSASNGDLSAGGIRGFQSSFLVDGTDNNNGFFSQARGRYRAPYQFSNDVVQEFRVSTNTYGAETGRAGAAVVNVVTKSGSNTYHGKAFYFLRDSAFNAQPAFVGFKPNDRQQQFGATVGGPIVRNKAFFFAGYDQHIFHVPTVVRFADGSAQLAPTPADYELSDRDLVYAAAASLSSSLSGNYRSSLLGDARFFKVDWCVSRRNLVSARINTSRYYGDNNVYFDPASPVTSYALSENGRENVHTETAMTSLTSTLTNRMVSHLRLQLSHDIQESSPNSYYPLTKISDVIDGFGRSLILPRRTRELKLHVAETLNIEQHRHSWKIGGDMMIEHLANFFPSQFGGEYIFDEIKVNPFTFAPQIGGLPLTPLRAYAHDVPRYYMQDFGSALTYPDTNEYAAFLQDTIRAGNHLAFNLGVRYDLQTFRTKDLVSNTLYPDSGHVPYDTNNVGPRIGFAYTVGNQKPFIFRGGYGMFYTRIPSIYTSEVQLENGLNSQHLFLDYTDFYDRQVFPTYPNPLTSCAAGAFSCRAPAAVAGALTTEISAFAQDFQTPFVQQASFSIEREVAERIVVSGSYLYTHGEHLIRARDVNLPPPVQVTYPVFDASGQNLTGYYTVDSFANWETQKTLDCAYPPCVGSVQRPIPELGSITVFESAASSTYNGFSFSAQRRFHDGFHFRLGYTWAKAIDDGQDALVVGRPATVQNSYAPNSERGASVTDQRSRFVLSFMAEPRPFHREHAFLREVFNDWKFAGVTTYGSGRPINATITGDANRDGNDLNDRLPGVSRNSYVGPDYFTSDVRLSRQFPISDRTKMELLAECFNFTNRDNKRVDVTDDGFVNAAGQFVPYSTTVSGRQYPAYFLSSSSFLTPNNAYAPRQVQFGIRFAF